MKIRSIAAHDHDYFIRAVHTFYRSPAVCHPIPDSHAERTFALLMHGTPYADCLIAEDDAGIQRGYILISLTWSNEAGGLCVWLEEAMVDPDYRSGGIGRKLIAAAHEKYNNAVRLRLEVTDDNPRAAALYRILGFTELPYQQMIMDFPPEA